MTKGSLTSLRLQSASLSPLLRYRMCCDIACGIAHLHSMAASNNLYHNIITLENIFLSNSLKCKIAGFDDISTFTDGELSHFVSTEKNPVRQIYAPPEILHNPFANRECYHDVYSFSVIATELIGWKRPPLHLIPICLESIKMGRRPDLHKIALVNQIENDDEESAKAIVETLISQIELCRKQATDDRPQIADVKNKLEEFWEMCDVSQLQNDIQQAQEQFPSEIDANKENHSLISLKALIPSLFPLPNTGEIKIIPQ